ncbi:MAG TPA: pimeloyl-ACP methyl ester esterase BioH [Acidiferrobacter sp.]|nr:pimeloyl-ACP methyl ester esterase BioH [Acidiferrobacter sp.]
MLRLLHGWGLNSAVFAGFGQALVHPTQALDLPGHGHAPYRPGDLDPERVAQTLARRYPEPGAWLGWSLGGLVALVLAARYPESVTHLILVGATPCFVQAPDWPHGTDRAVLAGFADQLEQDYEATLRRFLTLQAGVGERAQVRRLIADLKTGGGADGAALAEGLAILAAYDLRGLLADIQVPTLFIHGSDDRVVPPGAARWSADRMPHARLQLLGRGHAPFLSDEARCAAVIKDFLHE